MFLKNVIGFRAKGCEIKEWLYSTEILDVREIQEAQETQEKAKTKAKNEPAKSDFDRQSAAD